MDLGTTGSNMGLVAGYDGASSTYAVTAGVEGILPGRRYRFATVAHNSIGDSDSSPEALFTATELPAQPATLVRSSSSTRT